MEMRNRNYAGLLSALIVTWFVAVIAASVLGVMSNLGWVAIVGPVLVFAAWLWGSPGFRRFVLSADVRMLTFLQAWRVVGFVFIVAGVYGILPGVFAWPAGWGDLLIGLTAPLAATFLASPERRGSMIAWQALGILDLVIAVTAGVLASPPLQVIGNGLTTSQLMVLPLSVIPAFGVPIVLVFHLICITKLASAKESSLARAAYAVGPTRP